MDEKMTSGEIAKKAGVSQKAVRLYDEKGLLKDGVDADSAAAFAAYTAETAPTEGNVRGSARYRTHLIRVLTERALLEVGGKG